MKKITALPAKQASRGFTLIELLVVIGILGILAASLVATIDPFEQLKKAQDANVKNVLVEFLNATVRYYTTHNAYPWDSTSNNGGNCNGGTAVSGTVLASGNPITASDCITSALIGDSELKSSYGLDTGDLSKIYVTYDNTNNANQVIGCFLPSSKSQQKDANTKFDKFGVAQSGCQSQGGATACYWCTR